MIFDTEEIFARLDGNHISCFAHSRLYELEHACWLMKHALFLDLLLSVREEEGMLDSCNALRKLLIVLFEDL